MGPGLKWGTPEYLKEWKRLNPEKVKLYRQREIAKRSPRFNQEYHLRYYAKHRKEKLVVQQMYQLLMRLADPLPSRARVAVYQAVKKGRLKKPIACERCDLKLPLEGHHYKGYEKKFYLTVEWLCTSCHRKADLKEKT